MVAVVGPPPGYAGGPFEQIVGVGAAGKWTRLKLAPSGPRSEDSLSGRRTRASGVGYVRIYTLIGDLPGIPGRYFPATGVLCLSWADQPSNCQQLRPEGRRLLNPLARLARFHRAPTQLVGVEPAAGALRTSNVHLGLELALARRPIPSAQPPRPGALALTLIWRGPDADQRPRRVLLDTRGVWARGHLYPAPRGVWPYIAANAPPQTTRGTTSAATRSRATWPVGRQVGADLAIGRLAPAQARAGESVELGVSGYLAARPWPALPVAILPAARAPRPRPCHGNGLCAPTVTPAALGRPPYTIVGSIRNWRARNAAADASGSLRFRAPNLTPGRHVFALFCPACTPGPRGSLVIDPRLVLTVHAHRGHAALAGSRRRDAGRLPLTRSPYVGVRCPSGNSIACDRIGLAVWLAQRPTRLRATIAGHAFVLHPPPPGPLSDAGYWQGSLQPAGMLRPGPTHVIPDRGPFYWAGRHPRSFWVRLTATYPHQRDASVRIRVRLHAGWG